MFRRITLVAVAAAALALAPSAAMAYDAPGYGSTTTDSTPASGSPTTVTVTGVAANAPVTLSITSTPASISGNDITIAGTKSEINNANASGVATFTVTLSAPGSYALEASTGTPSVVVSTQVLTVAAVGAPAAGGAELSDTGFDGMGLAVGAGALVLAGAGAVFFAKRRQTAKISA